MGGGSSTLINADQSKAGTDAANTAISQGYGNAKNNQALVGQYLGQASGVANQPLNAIQGDIGTNTMNQYLSQYLPSSTYNQQQGLQSYLGSANPIAGTIMGNTSALQQGLNQQAQYQSGLAGQNINTAYAQRGALGSGAAANAAAIGMAQPFADVQNQIGQSQVNQVGSLLNNSLGQQYGNSQYGAGYGLNYGNMGLSAGSQGLNANLSGQQSNLQAQLQQMGLAQQPYLQGMGNQTNMYGSNIGYAGQGLGILGTYGNPMYQQNPSGLDQFSQLLGSLSSAAGTVKSIAACMPPNAKIDLPNGKKKRITQVKPGALVVGYNGKPVRVISVVKHTEMWTGKNKFLQWISAYGVVRLCDAHIIEGRTMREYMGKIAKVMKTPKYSYDLITEDGGYRMASFKVQSMMKPFIDAVDTAIKIGA